MRKMLFDTMLCVGQMKHLCRRHYRWYLVATMKNKKDIFIHLDVAIVNKTQVSRLTMTC